MSRSPSHRFLALDALRGLAILGMLLSAAIPHGILPDWMYHAQVPPPDHIFDPSIPGITWVDLVFPFFLFALGVSIPLALGKRVDRGDRNAALSMRVITRGIALGAFAIVLQHVRPAVLAQTPSASTYGIALFGFVLLFSTYARLPKQLPLSQRWIVRASGWLLFAITLAILRYPDGSGFTLFRSDIIIILLTNAAAAGGMVWVFTRDRWLPRLGVLGLLLAMRLGATEAGWVQVLWEWTPAAWIFRWEYLQYLAIVIPGTMVGDRLWQWGGKIEEKSGWTIGKWQSIALTQVALLVTVTLGLQERWWGLLLLVSALLAGVGYGLTHKPVGSIERLVAHLYGWGTFWLGLGLMLEPYELGIKKDPPTFSYYFVCTGLAIFTLVACTIAIHKLGGRHYFSLAISNGQNPMVAYVTLANLTEPILALSGIEQRWLDAVIISPWWGVGYGVATVWLTAAIVRWLTKRGVIWKT